MKNKVIIIVLVVFVILLLALLLAGNYFYNMALNPNSSKSFLNTSEGLEGESDSEFPDSSQYLEEYLLARKEVLNWAKSKYQVVSINSYDNLSLNGYYYQNANPTNQYVIVVHGYTGKALEMSSSAKKFYEEGYNVLAPDCRGHGNSEGEYIGMGWHDRLDIMSWINEIIAKDANAEITLYGVSMGGATVMMVSGEENLPTHVKCIVEDCGYSSVDDIFSYQLKDLFNLPRWPIIPVSSLVTSTRAGYNFKESSSIKQVEKSKTPTLFIHGDADTFVPFSMLDKVYDAANCEKEKYVVSGAGHGMASSVDGDKYWNKVFEFIHKHR